MNEIQQLIAHLQSKMKKEIDDLAKLEQEVANRKGLILNDKNDLIKILETMELLADDKK